MFSVRCLGSKNEAGHVLDIGGVAELGTHTNPPFNRELIGQRTNCASLTRRIAVLFSLDIPSYFEL